MKGWRRKTDIVTAPSKFNSNRSHPHSNINKTAPTQPTSKSENLGLHPLGGGNAEAGEGAHTNQTTTTPHHRRKPTKIQVHPSIRQIPGSDNTQPTELLVYTHAKPHEEYTSQPESNLHRRIIPRRQVDSVRTARQPPWAGHTSPPTASHATRASRGSQHPRKCQTTSPSTTSDLSFDELIEDRPPSLQGQCMAESRGDHRRALKRFLYDWNSRRRLGSMAQIRDKPRPQKRSP